MFSSQSICKSEERSERGISRHQAGVLVRQAAFSKTLSIKTIYFNILRWEQPGAMAPLQPLATPSKEQQLPSEKPSPRSRKLRLGSSSATSPRCGPPPFLERFHCLDCEVIVLVHCNTTALVVVWKKWIQIWWIIYHSQIIQVCSEDCDHTDHGLTLREGDMAQHVLTTGHR